MSRDVAENPRAENRFKRWYRETRAELAKVTWPTREEGLRLTGIVTVVTVIAAIVIFMVDSLFSTLVGLLLNIM
jgi:preprotein translocase subunit SecE